jgi:hypothetical protein
MPGDELVVGHLGIRPSDPADLLRLPGAARLVGVEAPDVDVVASRPRGANLLPLRFRIYGRNPLMEIEARGVLRFRTRLWDSPRVTSPSIKIRNPPSFIRLRASAG